MFNIGASVVASRIRAMAPGTDLLANSAAARLEYVGTRHRHHEARLAAFPTAGKLRRRWTSPRVAFRRAAFDPALNEVDLLGGETAFPKETCRCAIGRPRRHPPLERYGGDVGRALFRVVI